MTYIQESPQRYAQWIECFEILKTRSIDHEEYEYLRKGQCLDSVASVSYLEEQLVVTLNIMLSRCIAAFRRELNLYVTFGETENIHMPYVHFTQRVRRCFFFSELEFMSCTFRQQLTASLMQETERFWKGACRALYNACVEQCNHTLEDELYMVRRIRLFPNIKEHYE